MKNNTEERMNNLEKQIEEILEKYEHFAIYPENEDDYSEEQAIKELQSLFTESVLGLEAMKEEKPNEAEMELTEAYLNSATEAVRLHARNDLRKQIKQELLGGKA